MSLVVKKSLKRNKLFLISKFNSRHMYGYFFAVKVKLLIMEFAPAKQNIIHFLSLPCHGDLCLRVRLAPRASAQTAPLADG